MHRRACQSCRRAGAKSPPKMYTVPFKGWDVPVRESFVVCGTPRCRRKGSPIDVPAAWRRLKRLAKKVLDAEPRVALYVRPRHDVVAPLWWPGGTPSFDYPQHRFWIQVDDGLNWTCRDGVVEDYALPLFAISLAKRAWREYYPHTRWEFREVPISQASQGEPLQGGQKAPRSA